MNNQKEVARFIENFMSQHDYKLEYIANEVGVSLASVGHYKTGNRTPKDDFVEKFIEVFHLNSDDIMKFKMAVALDRTPDLIKSKLKTNIKSTNEELISIPVKATASAGNGYLNFNEGSKSITIRKNGFDKNCYLIEVSGDSMEPLIQDGAYIVVDPRDVEIVNNKIYIVTYNNETYIKKVVKNEVLKAIILKSINSKYDDIFITDEMLNDFTIKGRAVKFILEGNL